MKKLFLCAIVAGISLAMSSDYLRKAMENCRLRQELFEQQRSLEALQQGLPARGQRLQELQGIISKAASVTETVGRAVALEVESVAQRSNNRRLKDLLAKYGVKEGVPSGRFTPTEKEPR